MGMNELAPVDVCDPATEARRELLVLERIGRELTLRVERGEAGMDRLIQRHLDELQGRLAAALSRAQPNLPTRKTGTRLDDA